MVHIYNTICNDVVMGTRSNGLALTYNGPYKNIFWRGLWVTVKLMFLDNKYSNRQYHLVILLCGLCICNLYTMLSGWISLKMVFIVLYVLIYLQV